MTIIFTKEQVELAGVQPLLDALYYVEMEMTEATVEGSSMLHLLVVRDLLAKEIAASGYKGEYLDVAAYANARFEMEDDIPPV